MTRGLALSMNTLKQPLFLFYCEGNIEMKELILKLIKNEVFSTHRILIHQKKKKIRNSNLFSSFLIYDTTKQNIQLLCR